MDEIWVPVKNWEGLYEVSSLGRVRSLDRAIVCSDGRTIHCKGKILRQTKHKKSGHLNLTLCRNSVSEHAQVHRLVATAFLPPSNLPTVNHKDLNPENNVFSNLEWMTQQENFEHGVKAGALLAKISPKRAKKLTPEKIAAIRAARASGRTYPSIAAEFGIVTSTARVISIGQSWPE